MVGKTVRSEIEKKELFNQIIKNGNFGALEKDEIWLGINNGLSEDEIMVYARPGYDSIRMRKARIALENGADKEDVRFAIYSGYNYDQIDILLEASLDKVGKRGLEIIGNSELDKAQMLIVKLKIKEMMDNGIEIERYNKFIKKHYPAWLLKMIGDDIIKGKPDHLIECYTQFYNDENRANIVRLAINSGFSYNQIKRIANIELNGFQMMEIFKAYNNGLTEEQISIFADKRSNGRYLSSNMMKNFREALEKGIDINNIKLVSDYLDKIDPDRWSDRNVEQYLLACEKLSRDKLRYLINLDVSEDILVEVRKALENGVPLDRIQIIADNDGLTINQKKIVRLMVENNYNSKEINEVKEVLYKGNIHNSKNYFDINFDKLRDLAVLIKKKVSIDVLKLVLSDRNFDNFADRLNKLVMMVSKGVLKKELIDYWRRGAKIEGFVINENKLGGSVNIVPPASGSKTSIRMGI